MAQRIPLPFVGATQVARSININNQRSVNLFARARLGAKAQISLLGTPGLLLQVNVGTGPNRGHLPEFLGDMYAVSGAELYKIEPDKTTTKVGTLQTSGGNAQLVAGRSHLLVVDGVTGYTWDGTTFATITDPDFPNGATHATYLGGYFIVNKDDRAYVSDLENPNAWNPLAFTTAEADPDDVKASIASRRYLYLIGSKSTQVYYNSGNVDFPFDLLPNGVLDVGAEAPFSAADAGDDGIWMVARDREGGRFVVQIDGTQFARRSDPELEEAMEKLTDTSDAEAYIYVQEGVKFYVLTFPTDDITYACDAKGGGWHERKSWGIGRHRSRGHGYFQRKHWVGDYQNGKLYTLDLDTHQDDGIRIERIRRSQFWHKDRLPMAIREIEADIETGVGLTSGQGSDPQAMLRYSTDGGHTFSSEIWAPIGKIGEYANRVFWTELGEGLDWQIEVKITDPVKVAINGMVAEVEVSAF